MLGAEPVDDLATLPNTARPVAAEKALSTSAGKPFG
jgi:hypothetical protein